MFDPPNFYRTTNNNHLIWKTYFNEGKFASNENRVKTSKIFDVFAEYCTRNTIHGVSHLVDQNRHLIERVWWIAAIVLSLILCIFSIHKVKWSGDRVIWRLENNQVPIDHIPFPMVTICPINKMASKKFNYTDVYRAMLMLDGNNSRTVTADELKVMALAVQMCEQEPDEEIYKLLPKMYFNDSLYQTMRDMTPDFNETFFYCNQFGKRVNCSDIIFESLTERGLCHSFNRISLKEFLNDKQSAVDVSHLTHTQPPSNWNNDDGYGLPKHGESYPYRVVSSASQFSLTILLKVNNLDIDYLCGGPTQGFKIIFQPPNECPTALKQYFYLSPGWASYYTIKPKLLQISDHVKQLNSDERRCFLQAERHLLFYKHYTQRNCEVECLSNFTIIQCGCVPFSKTHAKGTNICGPGKIQCYRKAEIDFFEQNRGDKCNCLPSCTTISYHGRQTTTHFDLVRTISKLTNQNLDNVTYSRLIVSFDDEAFVPMTLSENHDINDFIATFGGLFSLFMGASLLSIVELIYYSTIRIYFAYKNDMRHSDNLTFGSQVHTMAMMDQQRRFIP